jgi:hypothetical protein
MLAPVAAKATIAEARACILQAVKIDVGRRALEGDAESAYYRLEEAMRAVEPDPTHARKMVSESVALLRTEECRFIAEDTAALEDAIAFLGGIDWR